MSCQFKYLMVMLAMAAVSARAADPKHFSGGLSGLWETELSVALTNGDLQKEAEKSPARAGPGGPPPLELALFSRLKLLGKPPYNAEWEAKLRQEARPAGPPAGQQLSKGCNSIGFPAMMEIPTSDGLFQVVVTEAETLILIPDGELRQIFTDGRKHPANDDLWPTLLGDSIGGWRGGSLTIDTVARKAGPISPFPGLASANLSGQAHFTERLRLIDADTLQNDMTIDDPMRFSRPWHVSIRYKRVTDVDRLIPTNCTENDRDTVVNGSLTITAPH